eukprot:CAMPEP_0119347372 /NCGR_PEP_ID=MMETSP1333-20130426/108489_1 /TAXON_ID=418940 /ORGANISM="Scyphosphaera apsteinii, Strain RCC1455" /LENGTH=210 /DNA_ID=CAMNT_0007359911 /DNA_START=118 /DNA_END=750 /DNA_ORIENTATION=+
MSSCFSRSIATPKLLVFSFVRDPVSKFESGVRQMWRNRNADDPTSADAVLDQQLRQFGKEFRPGRWINEHLQPSSWRLSGWDRGGVPYKIAFIGKVESLQQDLLLLTEKLSEQQKNTSRERYMIASVAKVIATNSKRSHVSPNDCIGCTSKLSEAGVARLCNSSIFAHDWACFGYPPPATCIRQPMLLCCKISRAATTTTTESPAHDAGR